MKLKALMAFLISLALAVVANSAFAEETAAPLGTDAAPTEFPAELDAYIKELLAEGEVPGAGLAVVKDGKIVVARGYGVRELGKSAPVDADTVFDIASLTKSFTAAAIATLVDEKKLSWDTPVRQYLPSLQPKDPYIAANLTLRDLLSHRVGSRSNAALFRGHLTRQQALDLFSRLDQSEPFRTRWVYSNVGYAVAGEVAAAVAGQPWEELVTKRLLEPLKMSRTTAYYDAVPSMHNYAVGHLFADGVQRPAPRGSERLSTAAAGAVHSSAHDLATWLLFQLGDGSMNGKQLISADSMEEMHAPQVFVPTTQKFRESRQLKHFAAYGFGWQVWDYRGHSLLWHTGNGDGQVAYMVLLPEERLGVAFVTNTWRAPVTLNLDAVARITDYYLNLPSRDYRAEVRAAIEKSDKSDAEEEAKLKAPKPEGALPGGPLAAYAGHYRDELDLDIDVALVSGALNFRYAGGDVAGLEHWRGDLFRIRWKNPFAQWGANFVAFEVDAQGNVVGLRTELMRDKIEAKRVTSAD